jgi:S1-C subfamily serine protease
MRLMFCTQPACAAVLIGLVGMVGLVFASPSAWSQTSEPVDISPAPAAVAPLPAVPTPAAPNALNRSVVKIFSTSLRPDLFKPWAKQSPQESSGSGVVIAGKRILTNAHVVAYASSIEIQASGSGDKFVATVVAFAPGIDLAVLKLDDESFFTQHPPIARANTLPEVRDAVLAYGFPLGGSSLSVTKGIVSRIEYAGYNAGVSGLRIQIDAAINPGNSGGPVVEGEKMIGVAYSRALNAQNIGYIIPNEEIELFLADVADGRYDGKPSAYPDTLQTLENPALRAYLKLDSSVKGIVVSKPHRSDDGYPLKKWDVITHIGDMPIDDQGMVRLTPELRLGMSYAVQKQSKGNSVPITVIRAGKVTRLTLPLVAERPLLIPGLKGAQPPYFIYGPVVFSKATLEYVSFMDTNNSTGSYGLIQSPLVLARAESPTAEREELVVISSAFFTHKLTRGYANAAAWVVKSVNGTPLRSLAHLVTVLRDMKDEFVVFSFDDRAGRSIVFPHKEMLAAAADILADNGVRAQASPALMGIWQAKSAP